MTSAEKQNIEKIINRSLELSRYFREEEGEYELAERYRGMAIGAMDVLNQLGYYCTREDVNSDWYIVDWED